MAETDLNKRKISGDRLYARCELELRSDDLFLSGNQPVKVGNLVFNMRGGCVYLDEAIDDTVIDTVFSRKRTTTLKSLTLFPENGDKIVIMDIKIKFLRARREMMREGMVFRFLNFSDEAFEQLERVKSALQPFDPGMDFPKTVVSGWQGISLVPVQAP